MPNAACNRPEIGTRIKADLASCPVHGLANFAQMLGRDDLQGPPRVLLILQIVLILNGDVVNLVLGIVGLVLLNNPAVRDYYELYGD